jgi:hypothetical protein
MEGGWRNFDNLMILLCRFGAKLKLNGNKIGLAPCKTSKYYIILCFTRYWHTSRLYKKPKKNGHPENRMAISFG